MTTEETATLARLEAVVRVLRETITRLRLWRIGLIVALLAAVGAWGGVAWTTHTSASKRNETRCAAIHEMDTRLRDRIVVALDAWATEAVSGVVTDSATAAVAQEAIDRGVDKAALVLEHPTQIEGCPPDD